MKSHYRQQLSKNQATAVEFVATPGGTSRGRMAMWREADNDPLVNGLHSTCAGRLPMSRLAEHSDDSAVLIVEDQADIRELLTVILEQEGYTAVACGSAMEALGVLQSGRHVCLILLDLMMPGISGFRFREEQQSDARLRDIPVIVISGATRPSDYHGNIHAVAYLTKPVNPDQLLELVHQQCPLHR
jgi:CheY-like chemotaxis protein